MKNVPIRSDIIRWGENGPEIQELSFEIKDESLTNLGSIEREMSPVSFAISAGSAKAVELYQAYYGRYAINFDFFSEAARAGFTQLRFKDAKIAALEESSDGMVRVELIPQTLKFGDADADEIDVSDLIDPYNTRFDGEARAARYDETSEFEAFLDLSDYGIAARIPVDLFWFGSKTDESFDPDTGASFEDVQSFPLVIDISDSNAIAGLNGSFIGHQELNARLIDLHQRLANDPALAESICQSTW